MQPQSRHVLSLTVLLMLITVAAATCSCKEEEETSIFDYVPPYNEDAQPKLPPDSVSYGIWGWFDIPAEPIDTRPRFIGHDIPEYHELDESLLAKTKCSWTPDELLFTCDDDSPLWDFNCNQFFYGGVGAWLDPEYPVIAECWTNPPLGEDTSDERLYRAGCLSDIDISYIFKVDGDYVWVNTPEKMKELLAPIESPEEALSYALMLTGMNVMYDFPYDPSYIIYFTDVVEATHVTETTSGYIVHLYHSEECGCDAFLTSQVDVIVNTNGSMEWGSATPIYLKVAEGMCVD